MVLRSRRPVGCAPPGGLGLSMAWAPLPSGKHPRSRHPGRCCIGAAQSWMDCAGPLRACLGYRRWPAVSLCSPGPAFSAEPTLVPVRACLPPSRACRLLIMTKSACDSRLRLLACLQDTNSPQRSPRKRTLHRRVFVFFLSARVTVDGAHRSIGPSDLSHVSPLSTTLPQ